MGRLVGVAANYNQCLFVLDSADRLYFRANSSLSNPLGSFWQRMQLKATSIALSTNTLYFLDQNGQLFLKDMIFGYDECSQGGNA